MRIGKIFVMMIELTQMMVKTSKKALLSPSQQHTPASNCWEQLKNPSIPFLSSPFPYLPGAFLSLNFLSLPSFPFLFLSFPFHSLPFPSFLFLSILLLSFPVPSLPAPFQADPGPSGVFSIHCHCQVVVVP